MTEILQADVNVEDACRNLYEHAEKLPSGQPVAVKVSGVEILFRRQNFNTFRRREVAIKVPGYKISDLSEEERSRIVTAIFNVFLIPGAALPDIGMPAKDHLLIRQDYIPMIPIERNPRLRSIAGGLG